MNISIFNDYSHYKKYRSKVKESAKIQYRCFFIKDKEKTHKVTLVPNIKDTEIKPKKVASDFKTFIENVSSEVVVVPDALKDHLKGVKHKGRGAQPVNTSLVIPDLSGRIKSNTHPNEVHMSKLVPRTFVSLSASQKESPKKKTNHVNSALVAELEKNHYIDKTQFTCMGCDSKKDLDSSESDHIEDQVTIFERSKAIVYFMNKSKALAKLLTKKDSPYAGCFKQVQVQVPEKENCSAKVKGFWVATDLFFKLNHHNLNNLWQLCKSCNNTKSGGDTKAFLKEKSRQSIYKESAKTMQSKLHLFSKVKKTDDSVVSLATALKDAYKAHETLKVEKETKKKEEKRKNAGDVLQRIQALMENPLFVDKALMLLEEFETVSES